MKTDWSDLIQKHLSGTASEEETQQLFVAVKSDDKLADLYLRHVGLDLALEAKAVSAEATRELLFSRVVTDASPVFGSLSWRPLALASVAGLALGMACTTALFGYVMPRVQATSFRLPSLVDGSFENKSGHVAAGFPRHFGTWSGDESEVVTRPFADAGHGARALRFVRAEREPALPNQGAASCDVYQLVDLRGLQPEAGTGEATLELAVQVLDDRVTAGEPVLFLTRLYVFSGSPSVLPEDWPLSQKEALSSGSGSFQSLGGAPGSWHQVSTKILLPPRADFAVVHLVAHKPGLKGETNATFGEQFADDVRLILKTQPVLPVRQQHSPPRF